ncbi:MAG TPA: hypothetical protein VLA48_09865 [Nitrososphaeraceae archaeon]|nr:hypothetical protein [Nitrososphaeraceae archaeon]
MTKIKVATINCENLFARYRFNNNANPENAIINGWLPEQNFQLIAQKRKNLTSLAIKETDADVVALQEVENLQVLRRFRNDYLQGTRTYKYLFLSDGNDPRLIDVTILSKYPIEKMDTYIHEFNNEIRALTFSRDCLECDIKLSIIS